MKTAYAHITNTIRWVDQMYSISDWVYNRDGHIHADVTNGDRAWIGYLGWAIIVTVIAAYICILAMVAS